jgi:hypothetical protein
VERCGVEALVTSHLSALQSLRLWHSPGLYGQAGLRRLAAAPRLTQLRRLALNAPGVMSDVAVLRGVSLPLLETLELVQGDDSDAQDEADEAGGGDDDSIGAVELVGGEGRWGFGHLAAVDMPRLRTLCVRVQAGEIEPEALAGLEHAPWATGLEALRLRPLSDAGCRRLAAMPLVRLRTLEVGSSARMTDASLHALAAAVFASSLTALRVSDAHFVDAAGHLFVKPAPLQSPAHASTL